MGFIGPQAVITLISVSILQKICPIYSLGRWLLCGRDLIRCVPPSDESLRQTMQGGDKKTKKSRTQVRGSNNQANGDFSTFTVSKQLEIGLDYVPLSPFDALSLRYYSDLVWILDFTVATTLVAGATCLYTHYVNPTAQEYGLNCLWTLMLALFSTRPLIKQITSLKMDANSGELVLNFMSGFFHLVVAMLLIITKEEYLSFGLQDAHAQFTSSAEHFLQERDITSVGPASLVSIRICLALISAVIGSVLTFSGLRLSRTHRPVMQYTSDSPLTQLIIYIDLLYPLYLLSLWVPPLSSNHMIGQDVPRVGVMTEDMYTLYRAVAILIFVLLRFYLTRHRLQAYLNTSYTRLEMLRRESGRISNVALRTLVTSVNQYTGAVAVQFVAPLSLLLALAYLSVCLLTPAGAQMPTASSNPLADHLTADNPSAQAVAEGVAAFSVTLAQLRAVFSAQLLGSLTSYVTFTVIWCSTLNTYIGLFYHTYVVDR